MVYNERRTQRRKTTEEKTAWGLKRNKWEQHIHKQSSNMRALLVLTLLCAVVCVAQVGAEMKAVKLCGREFLRAVVYTCGGSRWRRFLVESDMEGLSTGEQSSLESLSSSSSSSSSGLGSQMTRRDSNMLTTVCCQVGCRKSDLTYLC